MGRDGTDSDELACLTALRAGRARFFNAIAERAMETAPAKRRDAMGALLRDYVVLLRSDGAAQIAEFLYLIDELGLKDAAHFRTLAERHNSEMDAYLADPPRMRALGLTPQRIEAARFTWEQIAFIETVSPPGQLYLDQSSLGRLLAEAMAPESCRKVTVALAEGGLLRRHNIGHVLISSDGTLEALYREHLTGIVRTVKGRA